MSTNFPNGISSYGVPVIPGNFTTGSVFFVSSTTGADGNNGKTKNKPFATINRALSFCTGNKGDIVYVMPAHQENLGDTSTTGAMDIDVVGVSVIGIGTGPLQPNIEFDDADADFIIGANAVTIENLHFEATVTDVKLGVAIEASVTDTVIRGCRFSSETTTTDEFVTSINLLAGCDRTLIEGNFIDNGLGGSVDGILLVGASADVCIKNNVIKGDYSTANIGGITTLSTEVDICGNLLVNGASGALGTQPVIELLTGTTGVVRDNYIVCNLATMLASIAADTVVLFENYYNEDITGTGALIGTASADG